MEVHFPARLLGSGPNNTVTNLSADAILSVDGMDVGRVPATAVFQGGSPEQVSVVRAYDDEFGVWIEVDDALVRLRAIRLTLACPDGSNSLSQSGEGDPILYELGAQNWYSPSCPPQPFSTLECGCPDLITLAPTLLDFGTVTTDGPHELVFTLCAAALPECPPVAGVIQEDCATFTVTPSSYLLAPGDCQEVLVSFTGVHGGPQVCEILTTHGSVTCVVDDEVAAAEQPAGFALGEGVPNPFNPSTTLSYSVPETEFATLSVFNTKGQLVKTLVNGLVQRGAHKVVFDAGELASGVYICTLTTATRSAARKLVLVK